MASARKPQLFHETLIYCADANIANFGCRGTNSVPTIFSNFVTTRKGMAGGSTSTVIEQPKFSFVAKENQDSQSQLGMDRQNPRVLGSR